MVNQDRLVRLFQFERKLRRALIRTIPISRLKDWENPLEIYDSFHFKIRFHMHKETVLYVMSLIRSELTSYLKRGVQLPPILKFLAVLRYYCTGSFQLVIGDFVSVSQSEISILIRRVSLLLTKMTKTFIKFATMSESRKVREDFYAIAGFPGAVGAVDGCHIKIDSPGGNDAKLFRNRKGYFSLNVQEVCDSSLNFTNMVAKWYGSAHDSRIFENSMLSIQLEDGSVPGILLGDSGYPLLGYLMTPVGNPVNAEERRYNYAQIRTRATIEKDFGIWKRKFPVVNHLRVKLDTSLQVILATAVLHNISRKRNDLYENDSIETQNDSEELTCNKSSLTGRAFQRSIIESYFTY